MRDRRRARYTADRGIATLITLYHGGGAQDVELVGDATPNDKWGKLREIASRMLRARGHQQAAQLLNDIPFELHEGTNGFGDEFSVLYWSAPFDRYIEAAEWKDNPAYRSAFEQTAKTVTEVASTYIRFVAVELNTDEGPAAVESPNLQITNDVVERATARRRATSKHQWRYERH